MCYLDVMCDRWLTDFICLFFFKQKTAYEMRISDWSSDVCSSDLVPAWLGDRDAIDDPGDGVAVGADFGVERAVGIASQRGALALVSFGGDHGFGGGRIGRGPFNRRGAADQIDAQVAGVAAPVDQIGRAHV